MPRTSLLSAVFATGLALAALPAAAIDVGTMAPAFALPGLQAKDSKTTFSLADFKGKVVYVDFWASWCGPCQVSMPLLNELRNRLVQQGKPFEIVAIDVDKNPADGLDVLADRPVQYLTVSDPAGTTPASFTVKSMPTGVLLDGTGKVRLVHQGFKSSDIKLIEAEIQKLLAEAKP